MAERIVFTDEEPSFLNSLGYRPTECFDFGDRHACVVETDDTDLELFSQDARIRAVDQNIEFELQWDPEALDADRLGEMEDIRALHDYPEDAVGDGAGVTVAAMDSGVDTSHPVFDGMNVEKVNLTDSTNVDTLGHGTAVLGTTARIAPEADLVMLRVFGDSGSTTFKILLRAYQWCHDNADRVDIVNMSLGSRKTSDTFNDIHDKLAENGIANVVSAGNTGGPSGSPATAQTAYSVGACDDDGLMAEFSSYNPDGSNPDVTALGKNNRLPKSKNATMGEKLEGRWVKASGTSFSSPIVAGMVARLKSADVDEPRKMLAQTAHDLTHTPRDGQGLVQYAKAAGNSDDEDRLPTTHGDVWNFAGGDTVHLKSDWLTDGDYSVVKTTDEEGNTVLAFESKD